MLTIDIAVIHNLLNQFILPFFRVLSLFMVAPFFSNHVIPTQIRLALALLFTLMILPNIDVISEINVLSISGILLIAKEIAIGVVLGFSVQMIFEVFSMGGQLIAMQAGLGFASLVDPNSGVSVPIVSQFYIFMINLLFLAMNGHIYLLTLIADSFTAFPLTSNPIHWPGLYDFVTQASYIFSGALLVALPLLSSLLLVNVALGVMNRAAPQLNIFSVGFPILGCLAIALIAFTLDELPSYLEYMSVKYIPIWQNVIHVNH